MKPAQSMFTLRQFVPVLLSLAIGVSACWAADGASPTLADIEKKLTPIQQAIDDKLSNERTLEAAQRELKQLLQHADELFKAAGGELRPERATVALQVKILDLLAKIEARLPDKDDDGTSGSNTLSLPQYNEKKLIGTLANQLSTAHRQLAEHLRQSAADVQTTQKLVVELILAQEALAWEVGWPYTAEEATAVKKAGHVPPDVYLSRRSRGVERINERLKKSAESVGREPSGKPFVICSPNSEAEQKQLNATLVKVRGEAAAKVWTKGTQPLDEKALLEPARRR